MFFSQAATLGFHREVQSPEQDLAKAREREKKKKVKETGRRVGSGSIDRWLGLLARRADVLFVPSRNFRGKTSPVRVRILQHPVPHSFRSFSSLVVPPASLSTPILPSSIFRLRASTTPLPRFHFASYRLPPFLPKPKDSPRPFLSRPADTTNRRRWGKEIAGKASSFS